MLLQSQDCQQFFKLHRALMFFVNQRLKVISDEVATPDVFSSLPPATRLKVRDAFLEHTELLQTFVEENAAHFTREELDIVSSWQHFVRGKLYAFRQLKKHMIFLSSGEEAIAYGVLALSQPFQDLLGPHLPVLTDAVLLPFKGMIVYDGLITAYPISFGAGIRRSLNEHFKVARAMRGIVTALPASSDPMPPKPLISKSAPKLPTKEEKDAAVQQLNALVDQFCKEHLNDEYAVLCRKLANMLGRKRPSPLLHGTPNAWATGIVRAVGGVNFLHDKSQKPFVRSADIDRYFGVSSSTGAKHLAAIRKMFGMHKLDPKWTLPSLMGDNPLVWIVELDGFMVDLRRAPRELQEIAYNKGLIPDIPADRERGA
jgi:hypothetical protein